MSTNEYTSKRHITSTAKSILRDRHTYAGEEDPYLTTSYTDEEFVAIVEEEAPTLKYESRHDDLQVLLTKESSKSARHVYDNGTRDIGWIPFTNRRAALLDIQGMPRIGIVCFNNWDTKLCYCIYRHHSRLERRKHHEKMGVYFLLAERDNLVKIGWSTNIDTRLENIQPAYPFKLKLIGWIDTEDERLERELHRLFADNRVHGEWFTLTPVLQDYISQESSNA